jgi:hypothetical protein
MVTLPYTADGKQKVENFSVLPAAQTGKVNLPHWFRNAWALLHVPPLLLSS